MLTTAPHEESQEIVDPIKGPEATSNSLCTRRAVLTAAAGGVLLNTLSACRRSASGERADRPPPTRTAAAAGASAGDRSLLSAPVTTLLRALRAREISSEELVRHCLERITEVNPVLNAVVTLAADPALRAARDADRLSASGQFSGPLHGLPMTIKDSLDTAGIVSTWGTLGRAGFVPEADATVVARLRAAGAIVLGKTNTPELTLSYDTDNLIFGPTLNPYDITRSPGGSSGGAAAIVAAGGSPCDIGSDTGGSIRWPAHCCGIAGLRPTSGRVPRTGHAIGFGTVVDRWTTLGPLARSVDDLTLLFSIIAGPDDVDPSIVPVPIGDPRAVDLTALRVAFHTDNGIATPTPEIQEAVRRAASVLGERGAVVEESRPTGIENTRLAHGAIRAADGGHWILQLLAEAGTKRHAFEALEPRPVGTAIDLEDGIRRSDELRLQMTAFFADYDLILSPVNAGPAPERPFDLQQALPSFSYTQTYSLTGWPVVVVRIGTSPEGLPIGVQVVARPWREHVALAVAKQLEEDLGGFVPPAI